MLVNLVEFYSGINEFLSQLGQLIIDAHFIFSVLFQLIQGNLSINFFSNTLPLECK
ncbi:hypothetical protein AOT23_05365 [Klebsiella pneumoniae]|nr:hypothetical protein AOT23_05365 [Klebsiella pneumoniae]